MEVDDMSEIAVQKKPNLLLLMTILVQKSLPLMVVRKLVDRGFDVHVSYYYDASEVYKPDDCKDFAKRGRLHDLRFVDPSLYLDFIIDIIEKYKIDIIIQNGCEPIYPLIPLIKLRFPSIRIVDILYNKIGHTVSHFIYENAIDGVIVESTFMKEYILSNTNRKNRQVWINENGVDLDYFKPLHYDRQDDQNFVIGYIGRMSQEKNPLGFVKLANSLSNQIPCLNFKMFGDGAQTNDVRKEISLSKHKNKFEFNDFVSDVRTALSKVDVIIVPSIFDGRPNIIMEANSYGIPVICSPVGAIPEMVEDGKNGYIIDPDKWPLFAERILYWIQDNNNYRNSRQSARYFAENHFSNRKMFEQYAESMLSLLSK